MRRLNVVSWVALASVFSTLSTFALRATADQAVARDVALVVTGGTVVTMDGSRRVLSPGAVAIDGERIVGVGTPDEIGRAFSVEARHRRDRQDRAARAGQHARPCADGAVPGPGRRPGADGVAGEIHLPGRSQDGLARDGAHRHAPGCARDDSERHDHLHRHVLLRGGDRQGDQGCGSARGARSNDHPLSGRRREDARGRTGPHRGIHQGLQGRPAHHARRGAPLGIHAREAHAARQPRPRA